MTEREVKIAAPLWALGAATLAVGLLTRRKLFVLAGALAIVADRDAEAVRRARALVR